MKLNANGINLYYEKGGEGHPLVLIHGNGEDHKIFSKLKEKLEQHFTVYAFDSRNHGKSSKTNDYTYESMAEDYFQAVDLLGLNQPYLVGFSDGAIIGVLIETVYPSTFKKMALLGMNTHPQDFKNEIIEYMKTEYKNNQDPFLKMMLTQPTITVEQLSKVGSPSLVVFADNDLFKLEIINRIMISLPNSKLRIMEGHDHGSYIINEDILYPDLMSYFDE